MYVPMEAIIQKTLIQCFVIGVDLARRLTKKRTGDKMANYALKDNFVVIDLRPSQWMQRQDRIYIKMVQKFMLFVLCSRRREMTSCHLYP